VTLSGKIRKELLMVEIVHPEIHTAIGSAIALMKDHHPGQYEAPVWGMKNTEHLKNLGFVIGYKDNAKNQWYRVDFDPGKGLHINWEQDVVEPRGGTARLKEAYKVKPNFINSEDELYTWWRSATLHHCTELPDDVREKMGGKRVWRGAFWST
jgi:hypothetical protein